MSLQEPATILDSVFPLVDGVEKFDDAPTTQDYLFIFPESENTSPETAADVPREIADLPTRKDRKLAKFLLRKATQHGYDPDTSKDTKIERFETKSVPRFLRRKWLFGKVSREEAAERVKRAAAVQELGGLSIVLASNSLYYERTHRFIMISSHYPLQYHYGFIKNASTS